MSQITRPVKISNVGGYPSLPVMTETLIGYARCSTDAQDLTAQRDRLRELGVAEDRTYLDHGLTGTTRNRPGLDQALAAVREGWYGDARSQRPANAPSALTRAAPRA